MRELNNVSKVASISQINKEWLDQIEYDYWKNVLRTKFVENKIQSLKEQIDVLREQVNYCLLISTDEAKKETLYAFNFARELLNQPTVTEIGSQEKAWLAATIEKAHKEHREYI